MSLLLLLLAAAGLALGLAARGRGGEPYVRARRRGLPWVHSTIRVTRTTWRNWSGELSSTPARLYCDDAGGPWRSPRTLEELQQIVRDARASSAKVRVFGSSHSWSRLVPTEGFIVDNRMIGSEGGRYRLALESAREGRKARVTTPPGLLSGELEAWLWQKGYSLPASAFEDCFTIGGMVSTATHGAGLDLGTLSDMVVGMTFVDGRGEVRRWTRETASEDELAAIQCGLGCLGLVYDITLEVEPRYEVLHIARTYPYASLFADTPEARRNLRELHEGHTSIEFFWWPFVFSSIPFLSRPVINPEVWVLATQRQIPAGSRPRGPLRRFLHLKVLDLLNMMLGGVVINALGKSPRLAWALPWLTGFTNLWVRWRSGAWTMPQYDANHFVNASGVEFTRAFACEWSVPFRRDAPDDGPEGYERVRRAFDDLHALVVGAFQEFPLTDYRASPITLALEMRTLSSSGALLSPGYQPAESRRRLHYAAPEIVTTAHHPAWTDFAHRSNLALTANPGVFGDQVRCHHGKACHAFPHPDFAEGGTAAYLRRQYQAAGTWDRFLKVREAVDPERVFLNPYLEGWFHPAAGAPRAEADAAA